MKICRILKIGVLILILYNTVFVVEGHAENKQLSTSALINKVNIKIKHEGYKGFLTNKGIPMFILQFLYFVKTGSVSLNKSINYALIYLHDKDKYFEVSQVLTDAVIYRYNYPRFPSLDFQICILKNDKHEIYMQGEELSKRQGSFYVYLGNRNYTTVFGSSISVPVFKAIKLMK